MGRGAVYTSFTRLLLSVLPRLGREPTAAATTMIVSAVVAIAATVARWVHAYPDDADFAALSMV